MKFGLVTVLLFLAACRQSDVVPRIPDKTSTPAPDVAAQKREEDFRWKERCAVAGERLDRLFAPRPGPKNASDAETSISEVFYSPSRNSCVCEVSAVTGATNLLTLYDCLTREELGTTLINLNGDYPKVLDDWKRQKDALKTTPNDPLGIR